MHQFITSSDIAGITPEIILTLTAICVLSLEMIKISKASISLSIATLGIVASGTFVFQGIGSAGVLFGGMLKINLFSAFFDLIYLAIGIITLLFYIGFGLAETGDIKITILSTMVADYDYLGEWGFSALIESDGEKLLFDTGFRENTVLENAESLNIDLSIVEHVYLSHNHSDHTGGLINLRENLMLINPKAMKYIHVGKGILQERLSDGKNKNLFMQQKDKLLNLGVEFIFHELPEEILPNIWTTGLVPRYHNEKNWSGYREMKINGEIVEDNIPEDQSVVIKTKNGLILVSGCGHAGIVNTLKHSVESFENSKVYATIGGFHLFNKNDKEIKWTSKFMKTYGVEYFLGAHCTGIDAVYSIRKNNNLERSKCAVGSVGAYFDYKEGMFPGLITK